MSLGVEGRILAKTMRFNEVASELAYESGRHRIESPSNRWPEDPMHLGETALATAILIGTLASREIVSEDSQVTDTIYNRSSVQATILSIVIACCAVFPALVTAQELDPAIKSPSRDPNNPNVHLLDPNDPTNQGWNARREHLTAPDREAGLYDPQRYMGGFMHQAFPTYFGAPIAMTTEDLKAGNVDVAVVGITVEQQVVPGSRFAANAMRSATMVDWMQFAEGGTSDTDQWLGIAYMKELVLADYGNVISHWTLPQRTVDEVHDVIAEILAADSIPLGVGGTHVQAWGFITALAEKYGSGNVAMLHIDAHYDTYKSIMGSYVHNGSFIRQAVDKGLIKGSDIVQVGLRGVGPADYDLDWMRENKLRYHMMPEIERDGFDVTMKKVLEELNGKKVYISWDMDGMDPTQAPGVGTQSLGGLTFSQGARLLRAVAIQNEVVAIDFNEYNPLLDDRHQTTGVLMDRLMRSFLAGHAAKKKGITDPYYEDARRLDHGVPARD